jgi:hypothetical protein
MKRGLLILVLAVCAGVLAFFLTRGNESKDGHTTLLDSMPELAWLRSELGLSHEQFEKASELHRNYRPKCEEMCRQIANSEAAVAALAQNNREMNRELALAVENHGRVIAECKQSMLEHMYATAAVMSEDQAMRYLQITLPSALATASSRATTCSHE